MGVQGKRSSRASVGGRRGKTRKETLRGGHGSIEKSKTTKEKYRGVSLWIEGGLKRSILFATKEGETQHTNW